MYVQLHCIDSVLCGTVTLHMIQFKRGAAVHTAQNSVTVYMYVRTITVHMIKVMLCAAHCIEQRYRLYEQIQCTVRKKNLNLSKYSLRC